MFYSIKKRILIFIMVTTVFFTFGMFFVFSNYDNLSSEEKIYDLSYTENFLNDILKDKDNLDKLNVKNILNEQQVNNNSLLKEINLILENTDEKNLISSLSLIKEYVNNSNEAIKAKNYIADKYNKEKYEKLFEENVSEEYNILKNKIKNIEYLRNYNENKKINEFNV